jgi:hypothetical protein
LTELRKLLPFTLLGFDTDNDSVFMNETVRDYCLRENIDSRDAGPIARMTCPSADNLRPVRHFEKGGSGSSGLEFRRPAADAASVGLR